MVAVVVDWQVSASRRYRHAAFGSGRFQALIVEYESFDQKLPEHLSRPDAKLRRLTAVDPVADGDDGVEIVELDLAGDLPRPFRLNYTKFSYSCHLIQFV